MSHTFRYSGPFTDEEGRASVARQKQVIIDEGDCEECGAYVGHSPDCSSFDLAYYTGSPEE